MFCNRSTILSKSKAALICIMFVVGVLMFLIYKSLMENNSLRVKPKQMSIQWRYDGMRGSLKLGSYNTVYFINNVEVGVERNGLDRVIEKVGSVSNSEIRIFAYPTVNVGRIEKMPDMLSNEIPRIIDIASRRNNSVTIIKTKDHIRDELPLEYNWGPLNCAPDEVNEVN